MSTEIKTVLILVEMDDGSIRQVLANKDLKMAYLHFLQDDGVLKVSEEIMPFKLELKDK